MNGTSSPLGESHAANPRRTAPARRKRAAFTLVELLVVIGIITVLIAILLPALKKAREQSRQIACLSNLRQLGAAFVMYCNDNHGTYPSATADDMNDADWVYWEPAHNPNAFTYATGAAVSYLGKNVTASVLRCPSDDIDSHADTGLGKGKYPYSYSANWDICKLCGPVGSKFHNPPCRVGQVRCPERKILLIDESSQTIDDGCWAADNYTNNQQSGQNCLSNRHDVDHEDHENSGANPFMSVSAAGRGNAVFADGHGEFIPRSEAFNPNYYRPEIP
jgi:prepilin-type N-terminal cleavage/methylation domain-containing protein/prepilin-type processing-associated H-X9-DG protein